ncbi:MAG: acyl--CoA ligase [Chloroflexi bacterium]|nr:acyl--CoA ligase [Chloroflexota bacterium]
MGKGAIGVTGGFWPEGVFRYVATPGIYLDEGLVDRPARRWAASPALLVDTQVITYADLQKQVAEANQRVMSALGQGKTRLCLAVSQPLELIKLFLGALKARCFILLANTALPSSEITRHVQEFGADLVIADERAFGKVEPLRGQVRLMELKEFWSAEITPGARGPVRLSTPSVSLVGRGGRLAQHTHASLLSGALSWSTFLPLREGEVVLALQPPYSWEGLYSVAAPLFRGGACALANWEDPEQAAHMVAEHHPVSTIVSQPRALSLLERPNPRFVDAVRASTLSEFYLSVPGHFRTTVRRKLQALLGVPVLTVFGTAETGPALAAHKEWYIDEAAGIPASNVDLWPLNPDSGNPLLVPWESVEFGELGVKSPMAMAGYLHPEETQEYVKGEWVRTGAVATMDPNGFFYLLEGR